MLPGRRAPWSFSLLAGVLIAGFLLQGFLAIRTKSPVFDETGDIAAGLSYVQAGEVRATLQHPPLLKELAGASLWAAGIRLPQSPDIAQRLARGAERAVGSELIAAGIGMIGIDGGTRCGPLWLDDSNVDWGQAIKQVKQWPIATPKGVPYASRTSAVSRRRPTD